MSACDAEHSQGKLYEEQLLRSDGLADEFVCRICLVHVVGCSPKLTKCSHLFCGDCLDQWFASNQLNLTWAQRARSCGEVPCPTCKVPLRKATDVFTVEKNGSGESALLWHMIEALDVKCARTDCQWTGTYGEYWQHLGCGGCGQEAVAAAEFEEEAALSTGEKLPSSLGSTTGSPARSATDLSADEANDFEQLPEAEADQVKSLPPSPEPSGDDLSSLIRALLELDKSRGVGVTAQQACTEEGGLPAAFGEAPNAHSNGVRPRAAASKKKKKASKLNATQTAAKEVRAQELQAAQRLQAQVLLCRAQAQQWQVHPHYQRIQQAQQWHALASQSPQYRMAASHVAYMHQLAGYQQFSYLAANHAW